MDPGPVFPTPGEGRCKEAVFRLEPGWEVLGGRGPHEWGTRGPGDAMRKAQNVLSGERCPSAGSRPEGARPAGALLGVCVNRRQEAEGVCRKPDRPSGCVTPTRGPSCLLPLACWDRLQESLHSPCPSVPTRCAGGGGHDAQRQGSVGVDSLRSSAGHLQGTHCPWRELVGLPRGHGSPRHRWRPEDLGSGWLGSCCLSHQVTSP